MSHVELCHLELNYHGMECPAVCGCNFEEMDLFFGPDGDGSLKVECKCCGKHVTVVDPAAARVLGTILQMVEALMGNTQELTNYVD